MKKKKYLIYLFVIVFGLSNLLFSQNTYEEQTEYSVSKSFISLNEFRFVDYSVNNNFLLKSNNCDSSIFYAAQLKSDNNEFKLDKLFSISNTNLFELVQFSQSNEQIVYKKNKSDKKVWEIFNINTGSFREIESEEGSVVAASIYNFNNYLYTTNPQKERRKAYLVKDNGAPYYLGNGSSVVWSPNMKYFLLRSPLDSTLSLREKYKFGKISSGEYRRQLSIQGGPKREIFRRYAIYNIEGKKLLILKDFDFVDWIQWSPDGKKLVIESRNDRGFKIVYLNFLIENKVTIDSVFHFNGIPDTEKGKYTYCQTPKWSPDSNRILFTTGVEDGHQVLDYNIYIIEDNTYKYFQVKDEPDDVVNMANWFSEKSIILPNYRTNMIIKYTYDFHH